MSIQALREQRAAISDSLKDLVNKKDWSVENDQPIYDQKMAEIESINQRIENIERINQLAAEEAERNGVIEASGRVAKDKASPAAALFGNWLRGGEKGLNAEEQRAFLNTMSTTTGSEGGYTVQAEVAATVLDALKSLGGMRAAATVIQTGAGNDLSYPTSDGTTEEGEIMAQNAAANTADPSFGTLPLNVYKYGSKIVTVPIELLQDSSVDVVAFVTNRINQRLARITNKHFTIGTGSSQPNGIVTAAGAGRVGATGQTLTILYDDFVELQHSVDFAYREAGTTAFMMHDSSVKVAKKIKDTAGRPIFLPGYDPANNGSIDFILGQPVMVNNHMPVMAANAKSVIFGDLTKYVIRDAMNMAMMRFDDSAYASKGQVGFLAFLRSGGNLMDVGGAVKYYQNSAT